MATKKIKKIIAPKVEFIVDITDCTSAADVYKAVAYAKIDKVLTKTEYAALLDDMQIFRPKLYFSAGCPFCKIKTVEKKPNIFKRIWNWVTGKK